MIKVTAVIDSGKVFIAKRTPPGRMLCMWEFPGGKIENGETPESCLNRELNSHADIGWVEPEDLGAYEFVPANITLVEMIRRGEIEP